MNGTELLSASYKGITTTNCFQSFVFFSFKIYDTIQRVERKGTVLYGLLTFISMHPCVRPKERPEEAEAKGEPLGGDASHASPQFDEQTGSEIH